MRIGELSAADLSAYVDGDLGWWRRRGIRRHLEACEPCREYVEQIGGTARTLSAHTPHAVLSDDVKADLLRAYAQWAAP